jgi:hypothetical protein
MQNRSRRLRAPLVGVSIETEDSWDKIGFCGVCGIDFELFESRWGKVLIVLAARKSDATASLSSSVGATFLFLLFVNWVIAMVSTRSFFSIIAFVPPLPFETLVKASIPRDLFGKDKGFLGVVDSFRRLAAVGMVKIYNLLP